MNKLLMRQTIVDLCGNLQINFVRSRTVDGRTYYYVHLTNNGHFEVVKIAKKTWSLIRGTDGNPKKIS